MRLAICIAVNFLKKYCHYSVVDRRFGSSTPKLRKAGKGGVALDFMCWSLRAYLVCYGSLEFLGAQGTATAFGLGIQVTMLACM